jgi:hypothetical protein
MKIFAPDSVAPHTRREWTDRFDDLLAAGWAEVEPADLLCHVSQLIEDMADHLQSGAERDMVLARRAMLHSHAGAPDAMMVADHMAFLCGILKRRHYH